VGTFVLVRLNTANSVNLCVVTVYQWRRLSKFSHYCPSRPSSRTHGGRDVLYCAKCPSTVCTGIIVVVVVVVACIIKFITGRAVFSRHRREGRNTFFPSRARDPSCAEIPINGFWVEFSIVICTTMMVSKNQQWAEKFYDRRRSAFPLQYGTVIIIIIITLSRMRRNEIPFATCVTKVLRGRRANGNVLSSSDLNWLPVSTVYILMYLYYVCVPVLIIYKKYVLNEIGLCNWPELRSIQHGSLFSLKHTLSFNEQTFVI